MTEKKILKIAQVSSDNSQSGYVYHGGGGSARQSVPVRTDTQSDTSSKYSLCSRISYCLDANYWKGTTVETFFEKHKRQLVIEQWTDA